MAKDDAGPIIAVGRLHRLDSSQAQVRYMAVMPLHQGKGIGGQILEKLEQQACAWGCKSVVLNARTTSLPFYLHRGYEVSGEAPTLFGSIAHKRMQKQLTQAASGH